MNIHIHIFIFMFMFMFMFMFIFIYSLNDDIVDVRNKKNDLMEDVWKLKSDYCQLSNDHLEQEQETRLRQTLNLDRKSCMGFRMLGIISLSQRCDRNRIYYERKKIEIHNKVQRCHSSCHFA